MIFPKYDINKIKYSVNEETFKKAVELYNNKKVINFEIQYNGYGAIVQGNQKYNTFVSWNNINRGYCDCYLGQHDTLCKHMIALAIYAVLGGEKITEKDMKPVGELQCSNKLGELNERGLLWFKNQTSIALKCIKPYLGPSKTWDANQASLSEGCNMLTDIFNKLPVGLQTTELIIKIIYKLDKKLSSSGVDDSNGIVGGFIENTIVLLENFSKLDPNCIKNFKLFINHPTGFDWEKPLIEIFNNKL